MQIRLQCKPKRIIVSVPIVDSKGHVYIISTHFSHLPTKMLLIVFITLKLELHQQFQFQIDEKRYG